MFNQKLIHFLYVYFVTDTTSFKPKTDDIFHDEGINAFRYTQTNIKNDCNIREDKTDHKIYPYVVIFCIKSVH